jgi:hypothetical protein
MNASPLAGRLSMAMCGLPQSGQIFRGRLFLIIIFVIQLFLHPHDNSRNDQNADG